ncbi:MAG TPA: mycofactocin system GMC family oxidoreductase MftG [Nocardia sp.]|uniref:mycofactocin dehydrogenase MftG n=1 Tax=Nocardia sp. TaxID=1821 RepID=UPI002B4B43F6|nr:mycofactocin system GMC family oxidoreductase MftG [Nocardia sp.]HLS76842.1 mycofactocin system GMC family oxidoreductase MftG [Nocardia sp.]
MTDTVRADTLIVGGGTAGCVLAARLSEDPAHTVTVLEAGRTWLDADAFPAALRDATRMPIGPEADWLWRYPAVLTAAGGDRVVTELVRGRVLGGSSSVNGGYFARARPADFAAWDAVAGGPGWDFASAVAAYCRGESDRDFADRPGHGGAGPIPVVRAGDPVPVSRAFAAAARAVGLPEREDLNAAPGDGPDTGLARVPCNVVAGRRVGAAAAYLLPAAHRPNLRVLGEAEASRVLVRRGRAVGVEFRRGGAVETATAERVVLCAGAVESAALLLRSGIGPDADAISDGVPLVHPAPVGRWFTDHPEIGLDYRLDARPAGRPTVPLEYVVDLDDIELRPYTVRFTPGVHRLGIALMRPRSAGVLGLAAGDPAAPPRIEHRYLSEPADRARLLAAAALAEELLAALPGARVLTPVPAAADPGAGAWLRERLGTSQHLAGTCRMGAADDERAVVDHALRVHGVDGLLVVDLSVVPVPLSRGPQASAVLIGERAAHLQR